MKRNFSLILMGWLALVTSCTQPTAEQAETPTEAEIIEQAMAIHEKVLTLDSHADTPLRMIQPGFDMGEKHDPNQTGSKVDYPRMAEGGLDAIFFAAFVAQEDRTPEGNERAKKLCLQMIDSIHASAEQYADKVQVVTEPEEAYAVEKEGKHAIFIGIENGYPVGNDVSMVEEYFNKGVRYITLCHSSNNDIADSSTDPEGPEHGGISPFGEEVVAEMNRLGVMVDVSHGNDSTIWDALRISKAPIIASHTNARGVCEHPRNMPDELLLAMKENGGVIQISLYNEFIKPVPPNAARDSAMMALREKYGSFSDLSEEEREQARQDFREIRKQYPQQLADVKDAIDHIDHIVKVAGIDHVGIGCDFDGGGGINNVFDVSEMKNITIELVRRGYSEEEIAKIWGGNLLRVLTDVREVAQKIQSGDIAGLKKLALKTRKMG